MDHELCFVIENQDNDLEQSTSGVEAESQFSCWLVVIDRVGNQVLLGSGADVFVGDPVLARRAVDIHNSIVLRNARLRKRRIPHSKRPRGLRQIRTSGEVATWQSRSWPGAICWRFVAGWM